MSDLISRQAAIDLWEKYHPTIAVDAMQYDAELRQLPPASCSEFPNNSDTISRQAAIEVIDAVFPVDPMKSEYAQGIACGAALAKTYVEQLPSAYPERCECCETLSKTQLLIPQPEQRWIPCSERLPEEYGEYLITWETAKAPKRFIGFAEGEETGVWDDQHDRFVFSWLPEDYIIERYPDWRVIAWMPLPEPYKGEQE